MGATIYVPKKNEGNEMQDISEIVDALAPTLGYLPAKIAVSFGVVPFAPRAFTYLNNLGTIAPGGTAS